jgi:hypothetical protein
LINARVVERELDSPAISGNLMGALDLTALLRNLRGTLEKTAILRNLRQFNEHWSRSMTSRE